MGHINIKFWIPGLLLLIISSCTEFLDEKPSKTTSLVPTTVSQLDALLNNYSSFYQEGNRTLIYSTDDYGLLTELYQVRPSTYSVAGVQFAVWDTEFLPFDTREGFWSGEYRKIFTANMVLANLPKVSGADEEKKVLEAEAYFVRAYSNWVLANTYCLPYTENNKNETGLVIKRTVDFQESMQRSTLEETYDHIEADLTKALELDVELKVVNNKFRTWRASTAAVNAFAARYYLNLNDYENALTYANAALTKHSELVDYNIDMRYSSKVVQKITINSNTDQEEIIEMLYPYTHDNQSDFTDMMEWREFYYFRMLNHESWWYIPSAELLALYDHDHDLRYKYHMVLNYSYDRGMTGPNPPAYEYPGYVFFYKDRIPSGPTVAEMLLIKAECLARTGEVTAAMNTVNELRAKRMSNTAPESAIRLSASAKEEAVTKILEERRREMPFTQRWYDIRRLNNNEADYDDIILSRTFYPYNNSTVLGSEALIEYTLPKNSRRYAAPIPNPDIESSEGAIKQNEY